MTGDPTAEFFAEIGQRGHEPRLQKCTGVTRFDLARDGAVEHWQVTITKGDLAVSRENKPADAVITADRDVFDAVLRGEMNMVAATLRGVVTIEGDWDLLLLSQRLFPAPVATGGKAR